MLYISFFQLDQNWNIYGQITHEGGLKFRTKFVTNYTMTKSGGADQVMKRLTLKVCSKVNDTFHIYYK